MTVAVVAACDALIPALQACTSTIQSWPGGRNSWARNGSERRGERNLSQPRTWRFREDTM